MKTTRHLVMSALVLAAIAVTGGTALAANDADDNAARQPAMMNTANGGMMMHSGHGGMMMHCQRMMKEMHQDA